SQKSLIAPHLARMANMTQVVKTAPTENAISSFIRHERLKERPRSLNTAARNTNPRAKVMGAACNLHHGAAPSTRPPENKSHRDALARRSAGPPTHTTKMQKPAIKSKFGSSSPAKCR